MLFKESCGKEEVIGDDSKCLFHAAGLRKTRFMLCSLVNVGVKIFKWLFGTVWTLSGGGLQGRHKASVAMAVWQKQRCILVLEPNATLIFSLANLQLSLHSLFVSPSNPLLSVSIHFLPASHANLKSTTLCKGAQCAKTV